MECHTSPVEANSITTSLPTAETMWYMFHLMLGAAIVVTITLHMKMVVVIVARDIARMAMATGTAQVTVVV